MDFSKCLKADKLVVQRTGAMGDVIWTTPLFKYMRDAGFPGGLFVVTQYPAVFRNNPYVTEVLTASPAWVFGVEHVGDLDWSYEANRKKHMLQAYCEVLGIDYGKVGHRPLLYPDTSYQEWAASECRNWREHAGYKGVIVVHAAATSPDRIWSGLRWEQLATWLLRSGFFVICVGADQDYHLSPRVGILDLVGRTPMLQAAALIESADAFIGPDSGLSNVAFSTDTKTLVLYGMATPHTRLPLGSAIHRGLTAKNCGCLGCLEKLPTIAPPLCREFPRAQCMDLISVREVIDAFVDLTR